MMAAIKHKQHSRTNHRCEQITHTKIGPLGTGRFFLMGKAIQLAETQQPPKIKMIDIVFVYSLAILPSYLYVTTSRYYYQH